MPGLATADFPALPMAAGRAIYGGLASNPLPAKLGLYRRLLRTVVNLAVGDHHNADSVAYDVDGALLASDPVGIKFFFTCMPFQVDGLYDLMHTIVDYAKLGYAFVFVHLIGPERIAGVWIACAQCANLPAIDIVYIGLSRLSVAGKIIMVAKSIKKLSKNALAATASPIISSLPSPISSEHPRT